MHLKTRLYGTKNISDDDSTMKACLRHSCAKMIEANCMDPKSSPLTALGKKQKMESSPRKRLSDQKLIIRIYKIKPSPPGQDGKVKK